MRPFAVITACSFVKFVLRFRKVCDVMLRTFFLFFAKPANFNSKTGNVPGHRPFAADIVYRFIFVFRIFFDGYK